MANERLENLRGRLTSSLEARIRDAIATGAAPRALLTAFSAGAMKQLTEGSAPLESFTEVAALEAIVQRFGRPPLLVRNKSVVIEPLDDLPAGTDALIKNMEYLVDSVGRVEFVNSSMDWGGTGWIVDIRGDKAMVVTNRHVAQAVARRRSDGTGVFMRATNGARYGANIDFAEEVDSVIGSKTDTTSVLDVVYLADDVEADVALLAVTADGIRGRRPIQLDEGGCKKGDVVALIGYPAFDSRNDSNDQARYFRDLYEVKRFAPGLIVGPGDGATLTHDCTSLGGNSGSPLIHIESGLAVGLHFSGEYGIENTAVTAKTLSKLLKGERPV
ncbi:MAG: serine protease, partial [Alphaproteobacteria bacterium]